MQRDFPQGIPTYLAATPCSVHSLRTMCAGCFSLRRPRMPWGAKKKNTEMELPEVSAHLCCTFPLSYNHIQNLESNPAIVPATTLAENFIEPEPDEVRWLVHILGSLC